MYLWDEPGAPGLHPLHLALGLVASGATTVLAERVARWAVDFRQRAVRRWLEAEHGLRWSNDRLHHVLRDVRRALQPWAAEAQGQRLLDWLQQAQQSRGRHRPVLAVGRDGVMIPMQRHGYQEASAAPVAVYERRGRRRGTRYLGQMPEAHQATLSRTLTALVKDVLRQWPGPLPRWVYLTDKGQTQDTYYQTVLRRMVHPRCPEQRLEWEGVLDFFHGCGYVSQLQTALLGEQGRGWYERMRRWLRERPQGVSQILRSALQHYNRRKMSKAAQAAFGKAYRYLRCHRRWMEYFRYRRQGLPLGRGVTEAACKTVFTERLKRAGRRWGADGGQVMVDLRTLFLSGLWETVVNGERQRRPLPEVIGLAKKASYRLRTRKILQIAA